MRVDPKGGKRSRTRFQVLERFSRWTLVRCEPLTDRTHQIRVHLAAVGHPLAGDWLYGLRNAVRPMLHSAELTLTHPLTNQPLRVTAPLPDDFLEEAARRRIDVRR
jgi:23S rRNA pseudouridine1911/1915/1917 synthase